MGLAQHAAEHLDRIRSPEMDLGAGMATEPSARDERQRDGVGRARLARRVDPDPGVGAPRAPDGEDAVLLAVEVDDGRAGQQGAVECVRALEAHLLGHRHQQLERAVGDRRVLDEGHHRGDGDPVVGAEGRAVGRQPVAVAHEHDPPFGRVVRAVRGALAHHVQVTLEDEGRRRLPAGRRRHADHEVPPGVLLELESVLVRPRANVLEHRLLVPRRARNRRQRLEVPPERAGLESRQH